MTISLVESIPASDKVAGTSITLRTSTVVQAGDVSIITLCWAGVPTGVTVTDSSGSTYTLVNARSGSGGLTQLYRCTHASGGTITSTTCQWTGSITEKAALSEVWSGLSGSVLGTSRFPGNSNSPQVISNWTLTAGSLFYGTVGALGPTSDIWTGDTDTTNGTWSLINESGTTGGVASSNVTIAEQHKILTASGVQTLTMAIDSGRVWNFINAEFSPAPPPSALNSGGFMVSFP